MLKVLKHCALLALVAVVLAGCGREKEPAQAALNAAQTAIDGIRADGEKFAGDKLAELDNALKSAKAAFDKGEYKEALAAAGSLPGKAQEVMKAAEAAKAEAEKKAAEAAEAAKAELAKGWEAMSAGLPQMADAVKKRLDILGKAKKLPEGLDKDKLAGMKSGLEEAMKGLEEAKSAATSGDFAKAVEAGKALEGKIGEMASALGLKPAGQ